MLGACLGEGGGRGGKGLGMDGDALRRGFGKAFSGVGRLVKERAQKDLKETTVGSSR